MQLQGSLSSGDTPTPHSTTRPGAIWLTTIELLAALAAVVLWLRGTGPAAVWVALAIAIPAARFALSPHYRADLRARLNRLWHSLDEFPTGKARLLPWLAALVLVAAPEGLLCLVDNNLIAAGDTVPAMLSASTIVRHGHFNVDDLASPEGTELPYYLRRTRAGVVSCYPSGMLVFTVPPALAARAVGADLTDERVLVERLQKVIAAGLAGLCLALFFLLALYVVPPGPAVVVTLLLGVSSAVYSTVGHGLWQHGGVIFWSLVFLHVEFRRANRPVAGGTVLQGLACALMFVSRPSAAVFTMVLGTWVLVRDPRRAVVLVVWAALAYAPWALLYQHAYETPLGPSVGVSVPDWTRPSVTAFLGLLISPARGLLLYQPWIVLLAAPLIPSVRQRTPSATRARCPAGWEFACAGIVLLQIGLISAWGPWWGGFCWGSRLLTELTPLVGLLCLKPVAALWPTVGGRRLVLGLALAGFLLLHFPATFFRADVWNSDTASGDLSDRVWSWSEPPFIYHFTHGPH